MERTDYRKMPRSVHRDNKDNYNESGWGSCGYAIRLHGHRDIGFAGYWSDWTPAYEHLANAPRKRTTKYLKTW